MESLYLAPLEKEISQMEILQHVDHDADTVIFLGGSVIEGLGNKYSDLDIFVLCKELSQTSEPKDQYTFENLRVEFAKIVEIGCDIEYWSIDLVNEIINQINSVDFDDTQIRVLNQLKVAGGLADISSLIHRMISGKAVFNVEIFDKLINKLDIEKFYRLMIRYYVNLVDNHYEDVMGNLETGRYGTAVIAGRQLIIRLLMAYLFSKGVSIDRSKWVYPKLSQLAEEDSQAKKVLKNFNKLYFEAILDTPESFKNNAENLLIFSNKTISFIEKNIGGL